MIKISLRVVSPGGCVVVVYLFIYLFIYFDHLHHNREQAVVGSHNRARLQIKCALFTLPTMI